MTILFLWFQFRIKEVKLQIFSKPDPYEFFVILPSFSSFQQHSEAWVVWDCQLKNFGQRTAFSRLTLHPEKCCGISMEFWQSFFYLVLFLQKLILVHFHSQIEETSCKMGLSFNGPGFISPKKLTILLIIIAIRCCNH